MFTAVKRYAVTIGGHWSYIEMSACERLFHTRAVTGMWVPNLIFVEMKKPGILEMIFVDRDDVGISMSWKPRQIESNSEELELRFNVKKGS